MNDGTTASKTHNSAGVPLYVVCVNNLAAYAVSKTGRILGGRERRIASAQSPEVQDTYW